MNLPRILDLRNLNSPSILMLFLVAYKPFDPHTIQG